MSDEEPSLLKTQVDHMKLELSKHLEDESVLRIKLHELQKMADSLRIQNKTMKSKINDVNEAGFMKNTGGIVMTINNGKLEIKSGTVEKLIERLWNQDQLSVSEYVDIFLHTYRSFTTSKVVWDTMMSVYEKHARIINPPNQSIRWSTVIRAEQEELTNQKIRLRLL